MVGGEEDGEEPKAISESLKSLPVGVVEVLRWCFRPVGKGGIGLYGGDLGSTHSSWIGNAR